MTNPLRVRETFAAPNEHNQLVPWPAGTIVNDDNPIIVGRERFFETLEEAANRVAERRDFVLTPDGLVDAATGTPAVADIDGQTPREWAESLKVAELREELASAGLDATGKKPELVDRLAAHLENPPADTADDASTGNEDESTASDQDTGDDAGTDGDQGEA